MAETFEIEIATPEKLVVQQRAETAQIPGKDGYLEYQDTRGFLKAAMRLLEFPHHNLCAMIRLQISGLLNRQLREINPVYPARPAPFPEVKEHFDEIEKLIGQIPTKSAG